MTTLHLLLQLMTKLKRKVKINWIPSHIGIAGNDKADEAAKKASLKKDIDCKVLVSLSQIHRQAVRVSLKTNKTQADRTRTGQGQPRPYDQSSFHWYETTSGGQQLTLPKGISRSHQSQIHRLRLGYLTVRQLGDPGALRECEHCETETDEPLIHYLIECTGTTELRDPTYRYADLETEPAKARKEAAALASKLTTTDLEQLRQALRDGTTVPR